MCYRRFDSKVKWPDEIVETETRWHHCVKFISKEDYQRKPATHRPMTGQMEWGDE
jgi:hypothetical protein